MNTAPLVDLIRFIRVVNTFLDLNEEQKFQQVGVKIWHPNLPFFPQ